MLRNLLLPVFLFTSMNVIAQKKDATKTKAVEQQPASKIDYTQTGSSIPPLKLLVYRDTAIKAKKKDRKKFLTEKDFDNGANLFVMTFNPNCSHCQDETQMIEKNIALFKKSKLVMVANPVMAPYLPNFYKSFTIAEYPSISIGLDSSGFINNLFLYHPLPQMNIYDSDRRLIKTYSGDLTIDSLIMYIQ